VKKENQMAGRNSSRAAAVSAAVCVFAAVAFAADPPTPATGAAGAGSILLRDGFEEGLSGWAQAEGADFVVDKDRRHGGAQSARITNAPATKIHFQQLQQTVKGAAPGDRLTAHAWVAAQDVADGAGAYMALEFLGAGGQRVDIAHSKVSRITGKDGWEQLTVEGVVPKATVSTRLLLIFHAHGTAWFDDAEVIMADKPAEWPDLGSAQRDVVIHTAQIVGGNFGGVGFHVFDHVHPASQQLLDEVIDKRWRELNPSFARLNHHNSWDRAMLDQVASRMGRFQWTGSQVYLTTWDPKPAATADELAAYARKTVDTLEFLRTTRGLTSLQYYCMSNELSLGQWGALKDDLPHFKAYHQAIFDELKARKLDIRLLATDASPIAAWDTIEWAAANMDAITGVYGGHHYIQEYAPDDERFYPWFLAKMEWGAAIARKKGKDFILGEFGCKQAPPERTVAGRKMDTCIYWDTPQEPLVAIQLAEAAIAAINGGVYAMANWTFADFPDRYNPPGGVPDGANYANKWGVFRWSGNDNSTRPHYYAYGLLTKFFRGPATAHKVTTADPRLRAAAVRHQGAGTWSIAVVNRNARAVPLNLLMDGVAPEANFRKYVYDPNNIPQHPFGDLQDPAGKVAMKDGRLTDTVGPLTLTVYTTAYHDEPPAPVQGLKVEPAEGGKTRLSWQASPEKDLCYYRVFRSDRADFAPETPAQIGSTIATHFTDAKDAAGKTYHYKVLAVDTSGNASRP
jgi:hypothetical protein